MSMGILSVWEAQGEQWEMGNLGMALVLGLEEGGGRARPGWETQTGRQSAQGGGQGS